MSNLSQRVQTSLAGAAIQNGYTRMVNGINETIGNRRNTSNENNDPESGS